MSNLEGQSQNSNAEVFKDPENLPPADFNFLLQMLASEAMVSMGMLPHPADNKLHFLPNLAKHFVDLLSVLEEKTRNNLKQDEAKSLEQILHQLRVTYVTQLRIHNK